MSHPRLFNARDKKAPFDAVYCGRGNDPRTGKRPLAPASAAHPFPTLLADLGIDLSNPYRFEDHGKEAMRLYLDSLERPPGTRVVTFAREHLKGMSLLCWCAPRPCHAEVPARLADGEKLGAIRADMLARLGLDGKQGGLFPASGGRA